jgi:hypothetical protein
MENTMQTILGKAATVMRRLVFGLIAILGLGCSMNRYPAEEFFEGRELVAARAIEARQNDSLPALLEGLDLNAQGRKSMTLLWFAILKQNFDAITILVRQGAKPEEQGIQGLGTAVAYALHNEDTRFLAAMLDGGLSPDHQTQHGTSLIQRAAGADGATLDHTRLLIERGADIDVQDSIGGTALLSAINTHQPDRAIYLVEQGASLSALTTRGVSPLWSVTGIIDRQHPGPMRSKYEELRDLMIAKGAKYPPDPPAQVRQWMKSQGMHVAE